MKKWVNERLSGYWTIEEINAALESQMTDIQGQIEAKAAFLNGLVNANVGDIKALNDKLSELDEAVKQNAADLQAFKDDLAQAKTDLTKEYTDAISKSITGYKGAFNDEINKRITSVNKNWIIRKRTSS